MAAASDKVRAPNSFHWPIKNSEKQNANEFRGRAKKRWNTFASNSRRRRPLTLEAFSPFPFAFPDFPVAYNYSYLCS